MTSSLIDRLNAVSEQVALKRPVRVASTANLALSGFQAIDGVTPAASDENLRVLVKNQAVASQNGIYLMVTGAWERADDFDGNRDVVRGTRVPVTEGNAGANKTYIVTAPDPVVIGSTGIAFAEIAESVVTSEFAKPRAPVPAAVTASAILDADAAGKQIDVDCTTGDVVVTLPRAGDLGIADGDRITIRYAAGTHCVTIVCQDSDAINGATSMALTQRYESLTLSTNGTANWSIVGHARPFAAGGVAFIKVVSRTLTTPPVSPDPGSRYIIAASGVTTGDWSACANSDVMESNGQGGWIRYTPSESWHAYVEAENKLVFFTGTAWQGLPNTDDPGTSILGHAVFQDQRADGTEGGTPANGAWTARTLQTSVTNTIPGCSLASNAITLPAGHYLVAANAEFYATGESGLRLKSTTTATSLPGGQMRVGATNQGGVLSLFGALDLPAQESFRLEYLCETGGSSGLGRSLSVVSNTEVYATVQILDLSALEGPKGDEGEQGPQGFAGFKFQYSATTTPGDPGAGFVRLNGDPATATAAYIDALCAEPGNPDVSGEIAHWGDTGGILRIGKAGAEQNWATFGVISVTDNGGYLSLVLVPRDAAGTFSNNDNISLQFTARGETGSSIPVYDFTFNAALTGDPGAGAILFDNADIAAATSFNISKSDRIGVDRNADLAMWDDDGAASNRGYLYAVNATTSARVGVFRLRDARTDHGSYVAFTADAISGVAPAAGTRVALMFVPAGATGATGTMGGTLGGTANVIPKSSGIDGATLQPSSLIESSAGRLSVNHVSTAASAAAAALRVSHLPSVASATGAGVAIDFETKNASSAAFTAASIQAESRTLTGLSEDADLVFKVASGGALTERARLRDSGQFELGSSNAFALKGNGGQTLTGGFATAPHNIGTISGTTIVPDPASGQQQYLVNNGAFQVNPMASDSAVDILVTNSSNAGTVSFSSNFRIGASGAGDALTSANGSLALISIRRINGISTYSTQVLTTF